MQSSKLLNILRSLDRKEFRRLEKFISHPYFVEVKQKQKVLHLFDLLKVYYPTFDHPDLEKRLVFCRLFPDAPFSVKKLDKVMTRLLQVLRSFIVHEYSDPDQKHIQQFLAEAKFYQEKSLDAYFLQSLQKMQLHQEKIVQREKDFYYNEYLINRSLSEFDTIYNKRKEDLNLLNTHQSLDVFYLVAKLEYACGILAQNASHVPLEVLESLQLIEAISPLIEKQYAHQIPIVAVFFQVYLLLKEGDSRNTGKGLQQLLEKYAPILPFHQLSGIQAIYRSFYIREYNRQQVSIEHLFALYKEHLEKGFLFRRDGIQPGIMKNLVNVGLKCEAYDWVWQFLEAYKGKIIGTQSPEEVYYFNLATYYFALKEYEKVLDTMHWYGEDNYYKIAAKRLELKVYYEQGSPILESKMDAFKIYLFRMSKKILPPLHQEGNNNFINFLRQICNPGTRHNDKKIKRILDRILKNQSTVEREWLLEKLKELQKGEKS